MKIVKVTYTTKENYAAQNQSNIRKVMDDLQQLHHPGINYHSCVCADGKTFIHTAFFEQEEHEKILFALPSFRHFQEQLKAEGIESPPKQELLQLVGTSRALFNS